MILCCLPASTQSPAAAFLLNLLKWVAAHAAAPLSSSRLHSLHDFNLASFLTKIVLFQVTEFIDYFSELTSLEFSGAMLITFFSCFQDTIHAWFSIFRFIVLWSFLYLPSLLECFRSSCLPTDSRWASWPLALSPHTDGFWIYVSNTNLSELRIYLPI